MVMSSKLLRDNVAGSRDAFIVSRPSFDKLEVTDLGSTSSGSTTQLTTSSRFLFLKSSACRTQLILCNHSPLVRSRDVRSIALNTLGKERDCSQSTQHNDCACCVTDDVFQWPSAYFHRDETWSFLVWMIWNPTWPQSYRRSLCLQLVLCPRLRERHYLG